MVWECDCLLKLFNKFLLPLCQTLFDHHQKGGGICGREAGREQVGPWTQTNQAHVIVWKLRSERKVNRMKNTDASQVNILIE